MSIDDQEPTYCATCRHALTVRTTLDGREVLGYTHLEQQRGGTVDHPPAPVPISQVTDPIQECDFCGTLGVAWVYLTGEYRTTQQHVTARYTSVREHREKGWAAHAKRVETQKGHDEDWGHRWAACQACATLIEAHDLPGLVTHVSQRLPRKLTNSPNKLVTIRGQLYATYDNFFTGLKPGRGRVTPGHPLGIWDTEEDPS